MRKTFSLLNMLVARVLHGLMLGLVTQLQIASGTYNGWTTALWIMLGVLIVGDIINDDIEKDLEDINELFETDMIEALDVVATYRLFEIVDLRSQLNDYILVSEDELMILNKVVQDERFEIKDKVKLIVKNSVVTSLFGKPVVTKVPVQKTKKTSNKKKRSLKKQIRVYNDAGFSQEYPSIAQASRELGLYQSELSNVVNGHRKSTKGYRAEFVK